MAEAGGAVWAPASNEKSPETESLTTDTVRPAEVVELPHTYTPRGATADAAFSSWLLPMPGSPAGGGGGGCEAADTGAAALGLTSL